MSKNDDDDLEPVPEPMLQSMNMVYLSCPRWNMCAYTDVFNDDSETGEEQAMYAYREHWREAHGTD